jgi:hypothetical protein
MNPNDNQMNEVYRDYGPAGCAGGSIALGAMVALLLSMVRPTAKRVRRGGAR